MRSGKLGEIVVTDCGGAAGLRCNKSVTVDQQHHLWIISVLQEIVGRLDSLQRRVDGLDPAAGVLVAGDSITPEPAPVTPQVPAATVCELIERIDCAEKAIHDAEVESEKVPEDDDLQSEAPELTPDEKSLLGTWTMTGGTCDDCAARLKSLKKLGKDTTGDAGICQTHLKLASNRAKREKRLAAQKSVLVEVTKAKYDIIIQSKRQMEALKGAVDIAGLPPATQERIIRAHRDGAFNMNVTLVLK